MKRTDKRKPILLCDRTEVDKNFRRSPRLREAFLMHMPIIFKIVLFHEGHCH